MKKMMGGPLKINGYESQSPLANVSLFSTEYSKGIPLNLYEVMLPDKAGAFGNESSVQKYINNLHDNQLDVAGVHFHGPLCTHF